VTTLRLGGRALPSLSPEALAPRVEAAKGDEDAALLVDAPTSASDAALPVVGWSEWPVCK
jgi:hypothetical protein